MKKKIIITGGLGYIGTELCKLYSGVSWHHNIVVIDNRFISERVNQLRSWNIEFIQGDILDKALAAYCILISPILLNDSLNLISCDLIFSKSYRYIGDPYISVAFKSDLLSII